MPGALEELKTLRDYPPVASVLIRLMLPLYLNPAKWKMPRTEEIQVHKRHKTPHWLPLALQPLERSFSPFNQSPPQQLRLRSNSTSSVQLFFLTALALTPFFSKLPQQFFLFGPRAAATEFPATSCDRGLQRRSLTVMSNRTHRQTHNPVKPTKVKFTSAEICYS